MTSDYGAPITQSLDGILNMTVMFNVNSSGPREMPGAPGAAVIAVSCFLCVVATIGILGNSLVIYVVLTDRRMRKSVTNLFITSLAVADLLIMLFQVPDMVQFVLNKGWVLGTVLCKLCRYVMVFSLYASVTSLMALCVERYIAIVHPITASILCSRRRIIAAICTIWPLALLGALPTALYVTVGKPHPRFPFPFEICLLRFPGDPKKAMMAFKYTESILFFFIPVITQVALYSVISKKLFMGSDKFKLHRKSTVNRNGKLKEEDSDTIRARKGVVKMLIASVVVYILSYLPAQVPIIYNTFARKPFKMNWPFLALFMMLAYVNSAANPIFYGIFSQNFRRKFLHILCRFNKCKTTPFPPPEYSHSSTNRTRFMSLRSSQSLRHVNTSL